MFWGWGIPQSCGGHLPHDSREPHRATPAPQVPPPTPPLSAEGPQGTAGQHGVGGCTGGGSGATLVHVWGGNPILPRPPRCVRPPGRSRPRGCAGARTGWCSGWSRTSRRRCSSRTRWSSGRPGWTPSSPASSNPTRAPPASPAPPSSSSSSGPSTGGCHPPPHRHPPPGHHCRPGDAITVRLSCPRRSSMVIRDLTLRSAASFGSFHLIRLLYDEYMYYLVEHRVAQARGQSPIAVMGEVRGWGGVTGRGGPRQRVLSPHPAPGPHRRSLPAVCQPDELPQLPGP